MLISLNKFNKKYSKYICDRCHKQLNNSNRLIVTINYKKKWDLCDKCYKALERGIKKGGQINENI